MYYGGAGWQFGKRKVSGMSNEEVNRMTPNDFLMKLHSETKTMVPTMAQGMQDMTPLVKTTLVLFGAYIREAIKAFPEVVQNILGSTDSGEFSNIPTSSGSSGNLPPQMASFLHYFATLSKATQGTILKEAEGNRGFTTGGAAAIDTSGVSLAQHEENKRAEQARLVADRANRFSRVQKFGSTTILPQVRQAITKRPAGQSAKMARLQYIKNIAFYGKKINMWLRSTPSRDKTANQIKAGMLKDRKNLRANQQLLVNLLARYRF